MPLRLYNSLTKKEEDFAPAEGNVVTMYTCGPTVYGRPHIGNYSSFLMADLLRRWLEVGHGFAVKHVKNITDVGHLVADGDSGEDKVEKEARRIAEEKRGTGATVTHQDVLAVAQMYTDQYLADEQKLGFLEPFARPKASEYVEQMKTMIMCLLASNHAYVTDDGIYFDVTSKLQTAYGALSGNRLDGLSAGARVHVNEGKRHSADFALWKFCVGKNEHHVLRWPSPKGANGEAYPEGFPGWHIECSAMGRSLLGDTIDIHTGGEDNIFPHHECEIAQSEQVTEKPFVRFWLHKRRIQMGEEKMSKSLGNVLSLDDIQNMGFDPMDLRYYLLSVHYRTQLRFTKEGMQQARETRRSIADWIARNGKGEFAPIGNNPQSPDVEELVGFEQRFDESMNSDLNVSAAIAVIHECMTYMNSRLMPAPPAQHALMGFVQKIADVFGCFSREANVISPDLQAIIDERERARTSKNFAESDRLRLEIEQRGYTVKDTKDGQVVRRA